MLILSSSIFYDDNVVYINDTTFVIIIKLISYTTIPTIIVSSGYKIINTTNILSATNKTVLFINNSFQLYLA